MTMRKTQARKTKRPKPKTPQQQLTQAVQWWLYEECNAVKSGAGHLKLLRTVPVAVAIQHKYLRQWYDAGASRALPATVQPYAREGGGQDNGTWALEWEERRPAFEGYRATRYVVARRLPTAQPVDWRPEHMLPEDHYAKWGE